MKIYHAFVSRLTQIEALVFSDIRLVGDFIQVCKKDIQTHECGRLIDEKSFHSQVKFTTFAPPSRLEYEFWLQGRVIACLTQHTKDLKPACQNQILKVAEYQGEDYHLDRSLFLACKRDRQNLCAKVKAGKGRIYDCLMKNKKSPEMSKKCRSQITRRQKLMAQDSITDMKYNGYSSCPLVTGYGKMVLAEFDYKNNFMPDPQLKKMLVFDSSKEHWRLWMLKKYMLPYLYWNKMMRGAEV